MKFSKAFDKLNNAIFLHKLSKFGVQGDTVCLAVSNTGLNLFSVTIPNTLIYVNGCIFKQERLLGGVPQDSEL